MKTRPPTTSRARAAGMTSVIAMMYLVLISSLAVGFYAATTTATRVANNDAHVTQAQLAAQSGMDFMRRQMAKVSINPHTVPQLAIEDYYPDLQTLLNGTSNLAGQSISRNGNTISIPAGTGTIKLDSAGNARFRATITDWAGDIVVKVDGYYGSTESTLTRAISMDFTRKQRTSTIFDYAVASKGQILMQKGQVTTVDPSKSAQATMMSALPSGNAITVSGGLVGGDLSLLDTANIVVSGGSVGGSSVVSNILSDHVAYLDEAPEFPTVDPTIYKKYAVNDWKDKGKVQKNILVKAGTNPKFNANDTVQGIMYIESPNQVTFNGNFKMQGFIVMETGASATDLLDFKGNLTQSPVPNGAEFDTLRATSGISIMAPNASVSMSGSTDSILRGSVLVKDFNFKGSADIQIDQGTLMIFKEAANAAVFNGKTVKFTATGAGNAPTPTVSYSSYYAPDPATYQELMP